MTMMIVFVVLRLVALGKIGDRRATNVLIERLSDESEHVRVSAAKGLGYLRDKRAIRPLKKALKDESIKVQKAAQEALNKISLK